MRTAHRIQFSGEQGMANVKNVKKNFTIIYNIYIIYIVMSNFRFWGELLKKLYTVRCAH